MNSRSGIIFSLFSYCFRALAACDQSFANVDAVLFLPVIVGDNDAGDVVVVAGGWLNAHSRVRRLCLSREHRQFRRVVAVVRVVGFVGVESGQWIAVNVNLMR